MDIKDVVESVMRWSDIPTQITLRQVCHLYYRLTEIVDKQCFWNRVFMYNIRTSYSPLYRSTNDALSLAVINNDTEFILSNTTKRREQYIKERACYCGRYNILELFISDPENLFVAKLGAAVANTDIEMIESLYSGISDSDLHNVELLEHNLVSVAVDLRLAVSILVNSPYILPLVDLEEGMKRIRGQVIPPSLSRLVSDALERGDLDRAKSICAIDEPIGTIRWAEVAKSVESVEALEWIYEKVNTSVHPVLLLTKLLEKNNVECAKWLIKASGVHVNVSEALSDAFVRLNVETVEYVMSLNKPTDWVFVFQTTTRYGTVASVHLLLKYIPSSAICPTEKATVVKECKEKPTIYQCNAGFMSYKNSFRRYRESYDSLSPREREVPISYNEMVQIALASGSAEILDYVVNYVAKRSDIDWNYLITTRKQLSLKVGDCLRRLYERYNNGATPLYELMF